MRPWLTAAILLLIAKAAAAREFYVAPAGSGTAATAPNPSAIAYANGSAVAGDVVRLAAGDYGTQAIAPAANGTGFGHRIAYVGDVTSPSRVRFAGRLALSRS